MSSVLVNSHVVSSVAMFGRRNKVIYFFSVVNLEGLLLCIQVDAF